MPVLNPVSHPPGDGSPDYLFFCPGCQFAHGVWVHSHCQGTGATWAFNGNMEKPTFSPSLLVHYGPDGQSTCHTFVRDGMIQFLGDCTHALRGQTVPMVAI